MARETSTRTWSGGTSTKMDDSRLQEMIRKRAYDLWVKNGSKSGRDLDNWLEAEKQVKRSL